MKKLYLITALFLNLHAFASGNSSRLSKDTWALLIILGVILIIVLAYLFLHAYLEHFLRDKKIQEMNESSEPENDEIEEIARFSTSNKSSDELLNLFLLKRKGVISDREYQELKDRLIRSRAR